MTILRTLAIFLAAAIAELSGTYAGVFLVGAMLWGWGVDGRAPDRFDVLGASLVLVGASTVLWGRRLFG